MVHHRTIDAAPERLIESHWVKITESGEIRGIDAGKKINGRQRHIVFETLGLMVGP